MASKRVAKGMSAGGQVAPSRRVAVVDVEVMENNSRRRRRNKNQNRAVSTNLGVRNTPQLTTGNPRISSKGDRILVSNREIVTTVNATFAAGVAPGGGASIEFSFGSTGGLPSSWLNKLAVAYDKYVVRRLRIEWQPILPVTASGTVALWFDSDPEAVVPTSYTDASGNMNAVSSSIFGPVFVDIRKDQLDRLPQYVTAVGASGSTQESIRTPGHMQFANSQITFGTVAGLTTIGYVWMDYQVEFLNPSNNGS